MSLEVRFFRCSDVLNVQQADKTDLSRIEARFKPMERAMTDM